MASPRLLQGVTTTIKASLPYFFALHAVRVSVSPFSLLFVLVSSSRSYPYLGFITDSIITCLATDHSSVPAFAFLLFLFACTPRTRVELGLLFEHLSSPCLIPISSGYVAPLPILLRDEDLQVELMNG